VDDRTCRTFALRLEYDGSAFAGSQLQANARTVQGALEDVLVRLAGRPVRIRLAGRTDAGVHATGQVAAVEMPARWQAEELQKALNALLPEELAVSGAVVAPDGFDPRRRAQWRRYRYRLSTTAVRSPLRRRIAWQVGPGLDVEAMRAAVLTTQGERDFAAFGEPSKPGASTVREMMTALLCERPERLEFEFTATAFLRGQVRRTVGQLVEVGRGKQSVAEFETLLRAARPHSAGPAAPAHGLCLTEVAYSEISFASADGAMAAGVERES
jgi:tRNA pseudouridine38-40 synthase